MGIIIVPKMAESVVSIYNLVTTKMPDIVKILEEHGIDDLNEYLAELEQMCDVIGLINNGVIVEHKTMDEIEKILESKQKVQFMCNYPNYAALLIKEKYKINSSVIGNSIVLNLKEKNTLKYSKTPESILDAGVL